MNHDLRKIRIYNQSRMLNLRDPGITGHNQRRTYGQVWLWMVVGLHVWAFVLWRLIGK